MTRIYHAQCNVRARHSGFARMLAFIIILASLGLVTPAIAQVTRTFTAGGSFAVPPGVTSIKVEAWGAGAGGGATAGRDGGGGGGAYASSTLTVVPGTNYSITIGAGGNEGGNGANSVFGSNVVVAAGGSSNTVNDNGGAGGTVAASTGDVRFAGGNGGNAAPAGGGGGADRAGGGGGASGRPTATGNNGSIGTNSTGGTGGTGFSIGPLIISGAGGNGADDGINDDGQNGFVPGGGGGGDGDGAFSDPGDGARGEIRITYTCPSATISYAGSPFCLSVTSVSPALVGAAGGTYSSTAGLTINGTTGIINPSTSTPGTYTITYAIAASGTSPYA